MKPVDLDSADFAAVQALRISEARFAGIVRISEDAIISIDEHQRITLFNEGAEKIFGYRAAEVIGQALDILIPARFLARHRTYARTFSSSPDALRSMNERGAIFGKRKDGSEFPAEASISKFEVANEKVLAVWLRDLTERRRAEEALRKSEATVRALLESASQGVVAVNPRGEIMLVNAKTEQLFGYMREELVGRPLEMLLPERFRSSYLKHRDGYFAQPRQWPTGLGLDLSARRKDGSQFPVEISLSFVKADDGNIAISFITDITERKAAEEQIRNSLEEKEVLLKEIHHRVKNSLQIVSSLLSLQSGYTREDAVSELLVESQNRVKSMALIHEKLYQSTDLTNIDFADYIRTLSRNLFQSYASSPEAIELRTNVDVSLGIDHAIPCGLIINELLSNSLKHAFPDDRRGMIDLDFHGKNGEFALRFRDDGIGLPDNLDFRKTETLGLQLVTTLTEQLSGNIVHTRSDRGTEFEIKFSAAPVKKAKAEAE
jgi:PAS domain S-box-containing protein